LKGTQCRIALLVDLLTSSLLCSSTKQQYARENIIYHNLKLIVEKSLVRATVVRF
jgi:hypothetical protein